MLADRLNSLYKKQRDDELKKKLLVLLNQIASQVPITTVFTTLMRFMNLSTKPTEVKFFREVMDIFMDELYP